MPDKHEKCAVPPVHANAPHSKDTAVDDAGSAENKRDPMPPLHPPELWRLRRRMRLRLLMSTHHLQVTQTKKESDPKKTPEGTDGSEFRL